MLERGSLGRSLLLLASATELCLSGFEEWCESEGSYILVFYCLLDSRDSALGVIIAAGVEVA